MDYTHYSELSFLKRASFQLSQAKENVEKEYAPHLRLIAGLCPVLWASGGISSLVHATTNKPPMLPGGSIAEAVIGVGALTSAAIGLAVLDPVKALGNLISRSSETIVLGLDNPD